MTNNKILYIVITVLVLVIVSGGLFFLSNNKGAQEETGTSQPETAVETPKAEEEMVDCGQAQDPGCFLNRMNQCLPVTAKMMGSDGTTAIDITILGVENEKCHFQRKLNNALNLDCYFPKGTLNTDTLDQMFGNDRGLQKVVDDACTPAGW
ncbi:MAG: hypothetical protein PHZ04_03980 [Patescibacteria group bacterium]|nr:hypothetical protein [Patescibacteria group bacterium]MDD5294339.1 hypothetical protein [Patescibacteria group bacterium]MDD5554044.1 hypothetical protein [Patescibacteria group bacterium]